MQEASRRQNAELRMAPAHQRFERQMLAGAEVDLGLVIHEELVVLDRLEQGGAQLAFRKAVGHHRRVEDDLAVAFRFRGVQRQIGASDDGLGVGAVIGEYGAADAGRDAMGVPFEAEGREQALEDACGKRPGRRVVRELGHQDRELIAAQARGDGAGFHGGGNAPRYFHQQAVAGLMPEGVVDRLEIVEIDQQQRECTIPCIALSRIPWRNQPGERLIERPAIAQTGQAILVDENR